MNIKKINCFYVVFFAVLLVILAVVPHFALYEYIMDFNIMEEISWLKKEPWYLKWLLITCILLKQILLYGLPVILLRLIYGVRDEINMIPNKNLDIIFFNTFVITYLLGLIFLFLFYIGHQSGVDVSVIVGFLVWCIYGVYLIMYDEDYHNYVKEDELKIEDYYMFYKDVTVIKIDNTSLTEEIEQHYNLSLFGANDIEI